MKQKTHWFSFLLLTLVVVFFSRALLRSDFFLIHDYTHPARIAEMLRSLQAGQFPPTWSQNLGFGYGMPLFLFYGPLPYFLGSLATMAGLNTLQSTQALFFLSNILAFFGAYNIGRRWGRTTAFLMGLLLLAAPYRAVDIYVRGALNEVFAIGILPWVIVFLLDIRQKSDWASVAKLSISIAALFLTHNLTALFSLPLIAIFTGIVFIGSKAPREVWLKSFLAGFWGVLLSLFYTVPAFLEKGSTSIESILSGYFDYHLHFLYIRQWFLARWGYGGSEFGPNDGISFHLGWPGIFLSIFTVVLIIIHTIRHRKSFLDNILRWLKIWKKELPLRFWVAIASSVCLVLSLFLTLNHSTFVWESVPLLSFVQFPWRILGASIVFLSILGGVSLTYVPLKPLRVLLACIFSLVVLTQVQFHQPDEYLPAHDGHFSDKPEEIRGNVSSVLPDYIPKDFNQKLLPVEPENRISLNATFENAWQMNDPQQLLLTTHAPSGTIITWNIAHFPGWKYFVNNREVQPERTTDGVSTYIATTKIESVGAQFQLTPLRFNTLIISLVATLPFAYFFIQSTRKHGTA